MSAPTPITDAMPSSPSSIHSKKKGRKKGKGGANKTKEALQVGSVAQRGAQIDAGTDNPGSPVETEIPQDGLEVSKDEESKPGPNGYVESPSNGHAVATSDGDAVRKLEALTKEREALMNEVQELRKQLETIKESHAEEVRTLQTELEESNTARETAEEQYQNLMGRVEKIKETLSDRLKRDKLELEETKERAEELEVENEQLRTNSKASAEEILKLKDELQDSTRELTTLRSRNNLSSQNWLKEKEDLARMVRHLKEEVETTSNAMGEWEVIAMEERSVKESLAEKVSDLQEELSGIRGGYDAAARERDSLSAAVDNLQRSLQEIQEARRRELREMVEASQEESKRMKDAICQAEVRATEAETARETLSKELERMTPFEKDVKEKNLLIGKLRHEAIVLNEHLTKALRYLKKTKPEDNVDRQIVTNQLLHFLNLDRADPKRFQILQVMAGYLNWTDEQREQAGLTRPGGSNTSLRLPASPFHRTPSTPSLNADFLADIPSASSPAAHRESLADLWTGFLERSAAEETGETGPSRKDSTSSAATRPDTRGGS